MRKWSIKVRMALLRIGVHLPTKVSHYETFGFNSMRLVNDITQSWTQVDTFHTHLATKNLK